MNPFYSSVGRWLFTTRPDDVMVTVDLTSGSA